MWCLADLDAAYLTCREDVLALYERPSRADEQVVCLDEKPVPLHADVRASRPGHVAKRDPEYRRGGTANVFGVVEPKAGRHFTCVTPDRSAVAFARMLRTVITAYPVARTIHLVVDNLNTHREKALTDHFGLDEGRRLWRCLTVHYTPKHGSWLNPAEIEISLVSRECLGKNRIPELRILQQQVAAWNKDANRRKRTIRWKFTSRDARKKFRYRRTGVRISLARH